MSDKRSMKVKNRLGDLMRQPGGRSVVEALRGAEKRIDNIKGDLLKALDRSIAHMEAAGQGLSDPPRPEVVAEIYQASNEIIAMAGHVGFTALDEVAHGLCELIDVFRAEDQWNEQAIRVHVDAVQLLRGLGKDDKAGRERVLAGLRKVWARFGVTYAPPAAEAGG